jgi:hypothetical protein
MLYTNSIRHSPVVDLERVSAITVENLVNNDGSGEEAEFGGNAAARYITRKVTLAEDQDAEDLKVFLTAYKPGTADIRVYCKLLNADDGDLFNERQWMQMDQTTSQLVISDNTNREQFREFEYTIANANLTGSNGEVQYVNKMGVTFTGYKIFAVKIVLLSTNSANVPRVRDFRAIALQL